MDMNELKKLLIEKGVPSEKYSLNGGMKNDTICIDKVYSKWVVYYSEKGIKYNEVGFCNEQEACEYFYNMLIYDNG